MATKWPTAAEVQQKFYEDAVKAIPQPFLGDLMARPTLRCLLGALAVSLGEYHKTLESQLGVLMPAPTIDHGLLDQLAESAASKPA
jgi:hypothetical protein